MTEFERQLLDLMLDGELPPSEYAGFVERIERDPVAVAYLADRALLRADLQQSLQRRKLQQWTLATTSAGQSGQQHEHHRGKIVPSIIRSLTTIVHYPVATLLFVSLALGAIWMTMQFLSMPETIGNNLPHEYIATLAGQEDCIWGDSEPLTTGQRLPVGALTLTRGQALLHFDGGARMVIVAPATIDLQSPGAASVVTGKVAVHAPDEAVGFRLTTAQGTAVDLGTEFVVAVNDQGDAECQVLEGEVEWLSTQPTAKIAFMSQGEARRFRDGRSESIPAAAIRFKDFVPAMETSVASDLLAYEPFDYATGNLPVESLAGGFGWIAPWRGRFVASDQVDVNARMQIEQSESRSVSGLSAGQGGSLAFGTERQYRMRELPVPLDFSQAGVVYFSFRACGGVPLLSNGKERGPLRLEFRSSTDYWTHDIGFSLSTGSKPLVLADGNNSMGGVPLEANQTVFVVCKIATSTLGSDQIFMRVYLPDEMIDCEETTRWTIASRDLRFDCMLDYLILAIPRSQGGNFDELRCGTSWQAVVPCDRPALSK